MYGKECTTGVSQGNVGFIFLPLCWVEVHEVMTVASDVPGSLNGEFDNITRDSWHHSHLAHKLLRFPWRHRRTFPCTLLCSPEVHEVDSYLHDLGYCKLVFSVVLKFVLRFLVSRQSQFVPTGYLRCGNCWEVGGQQCASLQPRRHSSDGWTRLACDSLCEDFSRALPVSCARQKSNRTLAYTTGCMGSADIWGACFQRTSSIDNHQKVCVAPASGGLVA